jgi:DNA-binding IclR family transcriptional regulator
VEVDGIPVCVDMINSSRPFKRETAPGRIIGDIVSVQGKLFCAFKPEAARETTLVRACAEAPIVGGKPLDRAVVEADLEQIRRDDVAFDIEGLYYSLCAVGCPIRDQVGNVIAAIAVVVPTGRFGDDERELCTKAVKSTADSLSAYLGWNRATAVPQK